MEQGNSFDLPNEIWIQIFSYLPYGDQRELRLVCRRFTDLIAANKFMDICALKLSEHNVRSVRERLDAKNTGYLSFKNLLLMNLKNSEDLQCILSAKGHEVRMLTVQKAAVFESMRGNLCNLDTLQLHCDDILWRNVKHLNLQDLKTLKRLELLGSSDFCEIPVKLLRQLPSTLGLQHLRLESTNEAEEAILEVLETHAPTLEYLRIHYTTDVMLPYALWGRVFERMQNLQTLRFSGNCRVDWLNMVFQCLPQHALLKHIELSGVVQVKDSLLALITRKWTHTLQKLELMFCVYISDKGVIELAKLQANLRCLNLSYCRNISNRGLLEGIAAERNTTLQELHLTDLPQLDEFGISLLAVRLPNLRLLSLDSCSNAVTDSALSQIFRYQTGLRCLFLDDCINITDDGLVGFGETPYSIARLRGLETLSLRSCRHLSNRALGQALQLPELRNLKLGYCHKITSAGIRQLVLHCPALENFVISSCLMLDDDALLCIGQGLKRLRKLNISNCTNLTERAIDYIVENCQSLQELIVCGIDPQRVCAMQERLLFMKPQLKELEW